MRMLRLFDLPDLAMSTETTVKEARQFTLALVRAGLAAPVGDQYRLIVNTGPKAPVVRLGPRGSSLGYVLDRNTGVYYPFEGHSTPAAIPDSGPVWRLTKVRCKPARRPHHGAFQAATGR